MSMIILIKGYICDYLVFYVFDGHTQECTGSYFIMEKRNGPLVWFRGILFMGTRGLGYWRIVCLLHIPLALGRRTF